MSIKVALDLGGKTVGFAPENDGGRPAKVHFVIGRARAGIGRETLSALPTERVQRLHCRCLQYLHAEDRAGRGADDLGIVRIDRTFTEDDCGHVRRFGGAENGAEVAGIRDPERHDHETISGECSLVGRRHPCDGEHGLRCDGRSDAFEYAFLQHDPPDAGSLHACIECGKGSVGVDAVIDGLDGGVAVERSRDHARTFDHKGLFVLACPGVPQQLGEPPDFAMARAEVLRQLRALPWPP